MSCTITRAPTQYPESSTLLVSGPYIRNAGGSNSFPSVPGSLGLSNSVPYTRASFTSVNTPSATGYTGGKTFNISILDNSYVDSPNNIYTGLVNSSCMDGLEMSEAVGPASVLSYSPPSPPVLLYDISFPDRPTLSLSDLIIPGNDTDVDIMAVMPDLFSILYDRAVSIVNDPLESLSTDAIEAFNDRIFNTPVSTFLSLRGLRSHGDFDVVGSRQKTELARDLLILSRQASNATVGKELLNSLRLIEGKNHADYQIARLENAKLNTSLALQNITMSVMIYNSEVQNAQLQYMEYSKITEVEVKKLELYGNELRASGKAINGNSKLAKIYQKQLRVVGQVFESFEQAMKLSEKVIELGTMAIKVDTLNIETSTKLIDGDAANSNNKAYQANTVAMSVGANTDAELAVAEANLEAKRSIIARDILDIDKSVKQDIVNSENDTLSSIASSTSVKINSIQTLFDLENLNNYNNSVITRTASNARNRLATDRQKKQADLLTADVNRRLSEERGKRENLTKARRDGFDTRLAAYSNYLSSVNEGYIELKKAHTQQVLNHTIVDN